MYNKKVFADRLSELRKKRWDQYQQNKGRRLNLYKKYACCKSQDSLADALRVERRTVGNWELGKTVPPLDKAVELCSILGCSVDYLLGADDLEGFGRSKKAAYYSGISESIISYALDNSDFLDCLNFFMNPERCSTLFDSITLAAWKEFLTESDFDLIGDPLKSRIIDIFNEYQTLVPYSDFSLDTYRQYMKDSLPESELSFSARKLNDRICVVSCMPESLLNKLDFVPHSSRNYDTFIDFIVPCSFNHLNKRAFWDVKKHNIANAFLKLVEEYLTE